MISIVSILLIVFMVPAFFLNAWLVVKSIQSGLSRLKHILLISMATGNILNVVISCFLEVLTNEGVSLMSPPNTCIVIFFTSAFFTMLSIWHYVGMAIERTLNVKNLVEHFRNLQKRKYLLIMLIWLLSLVLTVLPFCGWGNPSRVQVIQSCKTTGVTFSVDQSYPIFLLIIGFIVPFCMVVTLHITTYQTLEQNFKDLTSNGNSPYMQKLRVRRRKQMQRFGLMCNTMTASFIVTWLPYLLDVACYLVGMEMWALLEVGGSLLTRFAILVNPCIYLYWYFGWTLYVIRKALEGERSDAKYEHEFHTPVPSILV